MISGYPVPPCLVGDFNPSPLLVHPRPDEVKGHACREVRLISNSCGAGGEAGTAGVLACAVQRRDLLKGTTDLVRPAAPLTVLAVGSPRRRNPIVDSEFCPHVDSGRTLEGASSPTDRPW